MKCKYCKIDIPSHAIRCVDCDAAWSDGFNEGYKDHKTRINETVTALVRLAGFELIKPERTRHE